MTIVFSRAINRAQANSAGATTMAKAGKPDASGRATSIRRKAGTVATLNISAAAIASGTWWLIVASRVVARVARTVAELPCGQSARIQNEPERTTASMERRVTHTAERRSFGEASSKHDDALRRPAFNAVFASANEQTASRNLNNPSTVTSVRPRSRSDRGAAAWHADRSR